MKQEEVQSKRVGGATWQVKAGGAPFMEEPLSSMRRTKARRLSEAKVFTRAHVHVCVCVHVKL